MLSRLKPMLVILVGMSLAVIAAILVMRTIPLHIHDDFESGSLSWRWTSLRFVNGSTHFEREIVRSGHQALAITVHSGDRYEPASDTGAATERDELMESWLLFSRIGRSYAYSFSLYLPDDLPSTPQRRFIAHGRHLSEARRCRPDYPILALRYQQGLLEITREDDLGRHVLYQTARPVKGQWLDFRFVIKFDAQQGSIFATLDGEPIVEYSGPTVFAPSHGYPAHGSVYFKTGLYRDALHDPPWTMYVDEFRKDQCPAAGCQ